MRRAMLSVCLLACAVVPARAWAWSTQGGETLSKGRGALSTAVGYPYALLAGYHLRVTPDFEVIPTFSFYYAYATEVPTVGNILSAALKFRVFSSGRFHLALLAEPGFLFNYHPGKFRFGLHLGLPQALATYAVTERFAVHFGMRMPIALIFKPTVGLIPFLVRFGMEYLVSSRLSAFASMDMGAVIGVASGGSEAEFYPAFIFGISFLL